jgi:hypothetical protein
MMEYPVRHGERSVGAPPNGNLLRARFLAARETAPKLHGDGVSI